MCTVTYLPLGNNEFILTSSRDVPYSRERAEQPMKYLENGVNLWYPKDGKAGGTWIGVSDQKRLICLLNGGFEYHTSLSHYKKSRGLIVKTLLSAPDIRAGLDGIDLDGVEQFTLSIVDWSDTLTLLEFVWDGSVKHLKELAQQPIIWSSSTLYDSKIKELRRQWFRSWQGKNNPTSEAILEFHHTAGIGDPRIDVLMDRKLGGTVSITSISKSADQLHMYYEDVKINERSELSISKI